MCLSQYVLDSNPSVRKKFAKKWRSWAQGGVTFLTEDLCIFCNESNNCERLNCHPKRAKSFY